jgi:uncharacterized protein YchJ
MNPSCRCKEIYLTFISVVPNSESAHPAFMIRAEQDGSLIKVEYVEDWFQKETVQGVVDCFSQKINRNPDFFKKRATSMKQKGQEILEKRERQVSQFKQDMVKPGRNDPCPCGSGKKYKKCCGR